jgi:hypothetical protein
MLHQGFVETNVIGDAHVSYRHNLYVYPIMADLRSTSHRNIACRVEFMEREAQPSGDVQGLPCIFKRYEAGFTRAAHAVVSYHNKVGLLAVFLR